MIVNKDSYVGSKWMNGLGQTLQLVIKPDQSDFKLQQFEYRISVASLTTNLSPFSKFPTYTRWLLILKGGPVAIKNYTKNQNYNLSELKEVICFDGGDSLESQAQTAGDDFNFFLRKDKKGELSLHHLSQLLQLQLQDGQHLIYNPSPTHLLIKKQDKEWTIHQRQLFEVDGSGTITIEPHAECSFIHCFIRRDE